MSIKWGGKRKLKITCQSNGKIVEQILEFFIFNFINSLIEYMAHVPSLSFISDEIRMATPSLHHTNKTIKA